jgi:hypothetical protein
MFPLLVPNNDLIALVFGQLNMQDRRSLLRANKRLYHCHLKYMVNSRNLVPYLKHLIQKARTGRFMNLYKLVAGILDDRIKFELLCDTVIHGNMRLFKFMFAAIETTAYEIDRLLRYASFHDRVVIVKILLEHPKMYTEHIISAYANAVNSRFDAVLRVLLADPRINEVPNLGGINKSSLMSAPKIAAILLSDPRTDIMNLTEDESAKILLYYGQRTRVQPTAH